MAVALKALPHKRVLARVQPIRQWFGLTQEDFAKILGVSRATVIRWEEANGGPRPQSSAGRLLAILVETRRLAGKAFIHREQVQHWLHTDIPALDGKPIEVMVTRGPLPVRDVLRSDVEGTY